MLSKLSQDLSRASGACAAVGRDDEARRLARAARKLQIMAQLADDSSEIEPERT